MARLVTVTDDEGKTYTVNCDSITHVEHEMGEPAEPAVEAQDEVKDDPGEEPTLGNPHGRAPKKGHPKIEAKPGKDATPDKSTIKFIGGDSISVSGSAKALRDMLG